MLPLTWSERGSARNLKALISDFSIPLNLVGTFMCFSEQPGVHRQSQDLKALIGAYDRFSTTFPITHGMGWQEL